MYANKNNLRSELTANIWVLDTTISITAWEWTLWEADTVACLEHYESDICTKREMVKITAINTDTLTVTRWFATCVMNDNTKAQGNTSQTFSTGDFLSVYLSKELWESITTWITTNQTDYTTMVARINAPRTCINDCCQSWKDTIDCAYYDKYCWNAWFGTGADGDCVITEDAFLCADCEYNFNNLTICPDVLVRFEWNGVPTINVWKDFKNCGTIDLRAWYIPDCCQTDCWLEQWCTICNQSSDLWLNCGGTGWTGGSYSWCTWCTWCTWCPWSWTTWWYGGDGWDGKNGWIGCPWCAPDWCNWWTGWKWWSNPSSYSGWWWGWWWWWAWRFWNGGDGWNGGTWDNSSHAHWKWWNGWNSWLYWTGWTGWKWWSTWNNGAWNGWNWYYWWTGGEWWECWRAWDWWCGVVKWWTGGEAYGIRTAWNWWNAITNVYWFHLNARNIYNNCVNAHWWDWWDGWQAECWTSWSGWNGANGWQMIVLYENMCEEWCFDVSAGCGWEPWHLTRPQCWTYWSAWSAWSAGWLVLKSSRSPYIQNLDLQNDSDNEAILISWKDPRVLSWNKTVIRYSTTDYPANLTDWTLAVEETTRNQYESTPYSLTGVLDETTYYFTAFALDSDNSVIDTETWSVTTEFGWKPWVNTLIYLPLNWDADNQWTYSSWDWTLPGSTYYSWEYINWVSGTQYRKSTAPSGDNWGVVIHWNYNSSALWSWDRTVSIWLKFVTWYDDNQPVNPVILWPSGWWNGKWFWLWCKYWSSTHLWILRYVDDPYTENFTYQTGWHNYVMTYSNTNKAKMYVDWQQVILDHNASSSFNTTSTDYYIGTLRTVTNYELGYSNFIIESTEWTASDVLDYYNATKWRYWIS